MAPGYMRWNEYEKYCNDIVDKKITVEPYINPAYYQYTQLNQARTNRWLYSNSILKKSIDQVKNIKLPQTWVCITEPWCGDSAAVTPIIYLLSGYNKLIEFYIQLRDEQSAINDYLTAGKKMIPKFIIRNEANEDICTWGPRPIAAQKLYDSLKAPDADSYTIYTKLQQWYNKNNAVDIQNEFLQTLENALANENK